MSSYWLTFAASGDPNGNDLPQWPSYSRETDQAMEFGDTVQPRAGIRTERLDFMDRYYAAQRAVSK
jgi:para-nitrobenzyl esterase